MKNYNISYVLFDYYLIKKTNLIITFLITFAVFSCNQNKVDRLPVYQKDKLVSKNTSLNKDTTIQFGRGENIDWVLLKNRVRIEKLLFVKDSLHKNTPKPLLEANIACKSFNINSVDVSIFLSNAHVINGTTWDFDFEYYPCWYHTNIYLSNQTKALLKLNAGSWGYLCFSDTTYILGYYKDKIHFLSKGVELGK